MQMRNWREVVRRVFAAKKGTAGMPEGRLGPPLHNLPRALIRVVQPN